jgi:hypothetical protein
LPQIQAARAQQLQAGIAAAQAYQSGLNSTNQRSENAANNYTRIGMQQQDILASQQQQAQQQMFLGAQEQARRQQDTDMQRAQAQNQAALQDQHFQQQVQMQNLALSQSEQLRLQKLKEGDDWIQRQLADGVITQPDAVELSAGLRQMRGPLELRQAKAQAVQAEAHAKLYDQQADLAIQQEKKRADLAAQSAPDRTVPILNAAVEARVRQEMGEFNPGAIGILNPAHAKAIYEAEVRKRVLADPEGVEQLIHTDLEGKVHLIKPDRKGEGGPMADLNKLDQQAQAHYLDSYKKIIDHVDKQIAKDSKDNPGTREWWTVEKRQEAIRNDLAALGLPPAVTDYIARVREERGPSRAASRPQVPEPQFAMPGSTRTPAAQGGAVGSSAPAAPRLGGCPSAAAAWPAPPPCRTCCRPPQGWGCW